MPDDKIKYSEAYQTARATQLHTTDILGIAQVDPDTETGYGSKGTDFDDISKFFLKGIQFSSDLQTTNKTVIGAINEVNTKASQFDNMTATASGSIATFDNGGDDIPVSEFECEIVAQQASGTPTPDNPLAITGFSQADIGVSGKNLLNSSTLRAGDYNGSNPTIRVSQNLSDRIKCVAGTTYTFSFITGDDYGVAIVVTDKNNVIIETINLRTYNNITFTPTMSGYLTIVFLKGTGSPWSPITPADCQNLNPMVEIGDRETTYTPYTGNLYTVSFGQTIYGGRLIYANGQWSIEATHGYKDLGTLTWLQDSAYGSYFYTTGFSDKASGLTNMICSEYGNSTEYGNQQPDLTIRGAESGNVHRLFIRNNAIADATAFNTAIQGAMLCYELETPVIIPITSSTRVKTISGDNNIYSNTGDCELKYFTNKADSLAELIKAFVV